MIKDKISDYYDTLIRTLNEEYGEGTFSHTRSYDNSPAVFPHVYMKRLDGQDIMQTQDGEFHGANNAVEINAYHNKGVSEAEDWANSIRRIMTSPRYGINMACKYHNQVDNAADASIIRFVMRFESKTTEEEQ